MLKLKNGTIKNFMSVGAVSQAINFSEDDLVLVLGENLDLGGNDSRNGVGKSTILNGLSYALFGEALVKIKKDNLVNKVNSKGMLVTLEFEKDGVSYKIERGRKPNVFRFVANGTVYGDDETDEAQGDSRLTQSEIERVLGISHTMFKQIVALNTYNEPFLSMRSNDQRAIIEQLLGITKLSEKADVLKEQAKNVKDSIKAEEFLVTATEAANKRIKQNIASLELKSKAWEKSKETKIADIQASLVAMLELDVNAEIECHKNNAVNVALTQERKTLLAEKTTLDKEIKLYNKALVLAEASLITTGDSKDCPTCGHDMDDSTHAKVHAAAEKSAGEAKTKISEKSVLLADLEDAIASFNIPSECESFYSTIDDAYNHKTTVDTLAAELESQMGAINPYTDQISSLETDGIQAIDFDRMNALTDLKNHQDFLLKLLTNKDSFIRKKIIDQNLVYLNARLSHFLEKMGLPHEVKFQSDLEVEITQYGKDFDFDNLSRGERTRLILSLSWAFRDVYESLNDKVNLLFIDELLDSGLDTAGVESALGCLRQMNRDSQRNIFLISHRDELIGRISSILKITKEGGFTSFSTEDSQI